MRPLDVSQNRLARDIRVPVARINDIVHGRRTITADTALRLGAYFDTTPEFWLSLQVQHDLDLARRNVGRKVLDAIARMPRDRVEAARGAPAR